MNDFLTFPSSVSRVILKGIVIFLYYVYYIHLGEQISRIKKIHVFTIQTENIF